jgi:hypothetical protein
MAEDYSDINTQEHQAKKKFSFKMPKFDTAKFKLPEKLKHLEKKHFLIGGVLIAFVLVFLAGRQFSPSTTLGAKDSDQRTVAPEPLATQELNKSFEFPLMDDKGKEVAKIKYLLESANLQDAFIYQGKLATAVKGRQFLIFNIKITNPYKDTIQVNTKDYIRVKMNGSEEQLAPEIHNDPVEVQGNSTKYARIGLPINDTDKNLIILIGELQGKKETIKLNLAR